MAGDWIKMRGGLFSSPKLIAMSRALQKDEAFREWLTPGGSSSLNGQIISDSALRCVTGALLCVTWSWSREYGKALPNGDALLPHISIKDIDGISNAPGIGAAMESVGWAIEDETVGGVILPKFFVEHNVPLSNADKQRAYRERQKRVTEPLPRVGNKTVTRVEKSRVEKNKNTPIAPKGAVDAIFDQFWKAYPRKVGKTAAGKAFAKAAARIAPKPPSIIVEAATAFAVTPKAKGDFCPYPATWLNRGSYEDDPADWQKQSGLPSKQPANGQPHKPQLPTDEENANYSPY